MSLHMYMRNYFFVALVYPWLYVSMSLCGVMSLEKVLLEVHILIKVQKGLKLDLYFYCV